MTALADINVLLARFDRKHPHHQRVNEFFIRKSIKSIATCPLSENGFVRIFANPAYLTGPGNFGEALVQLQRIRTIPGHLFIPDDLSIGSPEAFLNISNIGPKQLTDLYLLALAVRHKTCFVTFDEKIPAHLVKGGKEFCVIVP